MKLKDISRLILEEQFSHVIIADGTEQTTYGRDNAYDLHLYYDRNRNREVKGVLMSNAEGYIAVEMETP